MCRVGREELCSLQLFTPQGTRGGEEKKPLQLQTVYTLGQAHRG